jgi:ADP-L-glycero-D-manno-heptose 6-epimerase
MIYKLAEQAKHYNKVSIFKDGEQRRDHIHVNEVVEANIAASQVTAKPGIYNIGSGQSITFNQIVDVIRRVKPDLETEFIDNPYEFYQDFTCADITNTKESIYWRPAHLSYERIEKYVSSIINNKQ